MFNAINKKTGDIIDSLTIIDNIKYQFPKEEEWYADPNEIESYDKTKVPDIRKIKVVYVMEKEIINFKGTKFAVSAHFRILNAEKLGINVIPETREHKLAKNWIYNKLIGNNDIELIYSTIKKPFKYNNTIKFSELLINKIKIGIEPAIIGLGWKKVDVLVPFLKKHELFGNGIAFEIQFSNQRKQTEINRSIDRVMQGFSVVWLHIDDFEEVTETNIELKSNKVIVKPFSVLIREENKQHIKNLKFEVQEQFRLLEIEKNEIINEIKRFMEAKKDMAIEEIKEYFNNFGGKRENINNIIKEIVVDKIKKEVASLKDSLRPLTIKCHKEGCNGIMIFKEGISKTRNPYKGYFCGSCGEIIWLK